MNKKYFSHDALVHFSNIFKDPKHTKTDAKFKFLQLPRFSFDEEGVDVGIPITLVEMESIINKISTTKGPEPDGRTPDLLFTFFELMG